MKTKNITNKLYQLFEEYGNPFAESSKDLIVIDTHDIIDESVITAINNIVDIGQSQFETFMKERVIERTVSQLIQHGIRCRPLWLQHQKHALN